MIHCALLYELQCCGHDAFRSKKFLTLKKIFILKLLYCATDALSCGADVVVQSSHKTLTSLSQTAMLHLGSNAFQFSDKVNNYFKDSSTGPARQPATAMHAEEMAANANANIPAESNSENLTSHTPQAVQSVIHSYFSMLTTTSPNAIFLASLDASRALFAQRGAQMVQQTAAAVNALRNKIRLQGESK